MENKNKRTENLIKTCRLSLAWNLDQLALESEELYQFSILNAHAVTFCYENRSFTSLFQTNYLLRDGIGVKLAFEIFGYPETENLNGTDLIENLEKIQNRKIAIFGASDATLLS